MNVCVLSAALLAALTLGATPALADSPTVPHRFFPGDPAKAQDVNDNFDALAASITDNDGRITTNTNGVAANASGIAANAAAIAANTATLGNLAADVAATANDTATALAATQANATAIAAMLRPVQVFSATGQSAGVFIANGPVSNPPIPYQSNVFDWAVTLTPGGQILFVGLVSGPISAVQLLYSSSDCTGQPYATAVGYPAPGPQTQSWLFRHGNSLYYVPDGVPPATIAIGSAHDGSACAPPTNATELSYPVYPNDPALTGIDNGVLNTPLRIGFQ